MVNNMDADDLATQGAKASASKILIMLNRNKSISAQDWHACMGFSSLENLFDKISCCLGPVSI